MARFAAKNLVAAGYGKEVLVSVAYAIGMADHYEGPIEDPGWLGIARTRVPGNAALSQRLIADLQREREAAKA